MFQCDCGQVQKEKQVTLAVGHFLLKRSWVELVQKISLILLIIQIVPKMITEYIFLKTQAFPENRLDIEANQLETIFRNKK